MICPNKKCGRGSAICVADKKGKITWGCSSCLTLKGDGKLYTGKKLWLGSEVWGKKLGSDELRADTEAAMRHEREQNLY